MIAEHPQKRYKITGVITTTLTKNKLSQILDALDFHNYLLEETQ